MLHFLILYFQVHNIIERERKELQDQILAEIDTTEIVYIEEALKLLKIQEEHINTSYLQSNVKPNTEPSEEVPLIYEKSITNHPKVDWFDVDETEDKVSNENDEDDIKSLTEEFDKCDLNQELTEHGVKDDTKNDYEEFPLIDVVAPKFEVPSAVEAVPDELTDIDIENQSKYFYFYQGIFS